MMMSCREVAERASEFLDEGQPLLRRMSFRMHLMMCRGCRRFVEGIRSVVRNAPDLRAAGDQGRYGDLASRLLSRDESGPGKKGG